MKPIHPVLRAIGGVQQLSEFLCCRGLPPINAFPASEMVMWRVAVRACAQLAVQQAGP